MNILLTGSTGFIGTYIGRYLLEKRNVVISLVRHKTKEREIEFDLCSQEIKDELLVSLEKYHIDLVIHAAAEMIIDDMSRQEQIQVFHDNILMTENIVSLCEKMKIRKLIHLSSMAVYPNVTGEFLEDSEIRMNENTECMYGLSKFCAENIFSFFLKGTVVTNLRLAQVYGKGMRNDRIIRIMERELEEKNQIEVWGNGQRTSNFIAIEKLITNISFFIENDLPGVFNIGDEELSYLELAERIIKEKGSKNSKIILVESGLKPHFTLNIDKLEMIKEKYNGNRKN